MIKILQKGDEMTAKLDGLKPGDLVTNKDTRSKFQALFPKHEMNLAAYFIVYYSSMRGNRWQAFRMSEITDFALQMSPHENRDLIEEGIKLLRSGNWVYESSGVGYLVSELFKLHCRNILEEASR